MRPLILAALFSAAVFAQAPTQDEKTGKPDEPAAQAQSSRDDAAMSAAKKRLAELLRRRAVENRNVVTAENVTVALGQPCAIPLRNVIPPGAPAVAPMKTFPPPDPSRFPIKEVPPPAPSCDDVKR